MIHPGTEIKYINEEVGYGVVAKEFIPMGIITWALDKFDREYTMAKVATLEPIYQNILDTYAYRNALGNLVLCWENARFVNYSFNSNRISTAYNFELATRHIHKGEQLTDDYGSLNVDRPFQGIEEGTERKTVFPDDLLQYHTDWDEKLNAAFKHISSVEQPLRNLLADKVWELSREIEKGERKMDSILNLYHDSTKKAGN